MSKGAAWTILSFAIILAFAMTGVLVAVTPVAAYVAQNTPFTYGMTPATNLHTSAVTSADTTLASPLISQPLAESCLLCYSPFHTLLTRLSEWMGK
ncbi:MAG: hypothetical protein ABSE06_10405 [Anaerolineaceae bacterium]|jgi:hypothetical protein